MGQANNPEDFMTKSSEIAKKLWPGFCDDYSRQHQGWLVSLETHDPLNSPAHLQAMAGELAFQGVVLQDHGPAPELLVTLGRGEEIFTHRIVQPTRIITLETDAGLHEGLLIQDDNGGQLRIRFRVPASPEALDGWVAL